MLFIYDFLASLPLEIKNIWTSKLSATKVLYLLSRYAFLAQAVLAIVLADPNLGDNVSARSSTFVTFVMGTDI